jgi:hypothetical protein
VDSPDGPRRQIDAPRPLKVTDIVEYKPRLVFAGDGTPGHPNSWNRDWFTFLPYQLTSHKFVIPYYVQTVDLSHVWDATKALTDPARWDMPPQDFDVTVGNVRGKGATVSAFDPITLTSVPVRIARSTPSTLIVHLSTVDYPRFLTINEAQPGPQIIDPKVMLNANNHVRVTWSTNIPASVSITYGADWENRSAQQVDLKAGATSYTIPVLIKGVVAVRIKAVADGIRDIWPHWDEDPQGQIVAPGGVAAPAATSQSPQPPAQHAVPAVAIALLSHAPLESFSNRYTDTTAGWSIGLPSGATPAVNGAMVEFPLETSSGVVVLRARYLPGGAMSAALQLPFTATGDDSYSQPVTLTGGARGTLSEFKLSAAAHPDMTNLRQFYLLVPSGNQASDLFVLSATGPSAAMVEARDTLLAIAASVTINPVLH